MKIFISLLLASSSLLPAISQAQIYKWVDENGKTHYSERKEAPGSAKVTEIKPSAPRAAPSPARNWDAEESALRQRQLEREASTTRSNKPARPRALSNGTEDGTDASRCRLARDVLSGAVRHSNGKPTDQYDREVAENDVRAFCR